MPALEKKARLQALVQTGKRLDTTNQEKSICNICIKDPSENSTLVKRQRLEALTAVPQRSLIRSKFSPQLPALTNGWFSNGFNSSGVREYPVEELYTHYRIEYRRLRRADAPPICSRQEYHFKRKHVLEWLKADQYKLCEEVISYGIRMWESLKVRYNIEAEDPHFFILYGFRKAILKEMRHTVDKQWGGHFVGEDGGETRVEILQW